MNQIAEALRINRQAVHPPLWHRLKYWGLFAALIAALAWSLHDLGLGLHVLIAGTGKLGVILKAMWPPSSGGVAPRIWLAVVQTLGMAVLGTALAAFVSIPLGLIAARNVVSSPTVHFAIRRMLDLFRGIPVLIWALIVVAAIGLGPLAGVLALAFADIPRMAKLLGETIENVDERQREMIRATGAPVLVVLRFGTLPQVLPNWLSQVLYTLEYNFRAAVVVGVVGGGGIGFELQERIRIYAYDEVAYIIVLYIVTVSLLDLISSRLRSTLT